MNVLLLDLIPIILREVQLVNPSGIALGFDRGPIFERTIQEEKLTLNKGDRLVAYTDGVVESMNAKRDEFGDKRFYTLVQQMATRESAQFVGFVAKVLDDHKGDAPQHDDITIVTVRRL